MASPNHSVTIKDPKPVEAVSTEVKTDEFIDSVTLPSKFKPYSNCTGLKIRPFSTEEVEKLIPIIEGSSGLKIVDVIRPTMSPLDPADLTLGDFWFVLAWLRINTFKSAPVMVPWQCPKCNASNNAVYDITKLKIHELPDKYKEPATLTLPSGKKIPLRLYRGKDEDVVDDYLKVMTGKDQSTPEEKVIPMLAITITNGKSLDANINMLRDKKQFSAEDLAVIRAFQSNFQHGLPSKFSDTCANKECGFVNDQIHFRFQVDFLIPSDQYSGYIGNAVQFG